MPVAPYGTEGYREWNAARMRRRRREGVPWDRNYEQSDQGQFMRSTYENSVRRMILRGNRQRGAIAGRLGAEIEPLEPKETMERINRWRDTLRMIERWGGWEMYGVRLGSGL